MNEKFKQITLNSVISIENDIEKINNSLENAISIDDEKIKYYKTYLLSIQNKLTKYKNLINK